LFFLGAGGPTGYHFGMHADRVPPRLAARLRAETSLLHRKAEHTGLMSQLLKGKATRAGYCRLLRNLHALYAALETGLGRHAALPSIAPIHLPELTRTTALESDLQALHGHGWERDIKLTPGAADYAHHLQQLALERPALLAAHSYVRHLGDLHGGQVLGRVVSSMLGMSDGTGTSFYAFAGDVAALISRYRAGLDALPQDDESVAALVAEACSGFARHITLFDELA
jgi:heme oxygenase